MKLIDKIRQGILKFLNIEELTSNPKSERLTFLGNSDEETRLKLKENRIWYYGDSNELLNFYTNEKITNASNPMFNRNRKEYFWSISSTEANIKRVHSGIPNAIITTLVNVIGFPKITANEDITPMIDTILSKNQMIDKVNQQQMPLTLAEGWGAWKISIDEKRDVPVIEYYDAERVEYVYRSGDLIGIIYKDYYKKNNKDYVLLEIRRIDDKNSYIEYELYRLKDNNEVEECELTELEELGNLQNVVIEGFPVVLGVESKYFYDIFNANYGRSIFSGKIDLFDDLDQTLSQDSQAVRVSTPVEYYPEDILEHSKNGKALLPNIYNRQYISKGAGMSADGTIDGTIQTTQPTLNFAQYSDDAKHKLDFILTGILSPATMGIDIAKKDNAEAQREKEKITIMTRNNIIARQTEILKKVCVIALYLYQYKTSGQFEIKDFGINIVYDEFANPSFENQLDVLGSAWYDGKISTARYVELLWGDKLSNEEKQKEIQWLDDNKSKDNFSIGEI